ncbi:RimK family alpha-L-glutamate ligase [Methylophilus sp. VKM B-3414]|uniref:ATP-grasp domain-containing protein n=1 Tax=Methylophilus sp. VKM B-3414 TaxID=3076121 RepID=UPI0028C5D39F|nr:RimK family alpha-L-glutamate ligase [Methylophilus sp. VKM B-3414]MDT7850687.1 RimK family alpha-L-glutamate ligase [Methylophilus sp. VKM B-3414]
MQVVPIFTDEVAQAGGWHGQSLAQAFARRGWQALMVSLDSCHLSIANQQVLIHIPGLTQPAPMAFVRGVAAGTTQQIITRMNLLHTLQRQGMVIYNSARAIETTVDKGLTSQFLAEQDVATPATWVCEHRHIAHMLMQQALDTGKTLVIKPLFGSQGKGVRLIESRQQFALPQDPFVDGVYYLQEKIECGPYQHDYRVFVVRGEPIAVMQRQGDSWLHNVARGARCSACDEQDVADIGVRAAQAVNIAYAGVDVMRDKHGKLWVIEVNSIPAWRGLQSITSFDIADVLVNDLLQLADA